MYTLQYTYTYTAYLAIFFSHRNGTQLGTEPLCVFRIQVCFSQCSALDYVFDVLIWCIYICIRFILYTLNLFACENCVKGFCCCYWKSWKWLKVFRTKAAVNIQRLTLSFCAADWTFARSVGRWHCDTLHNMADSVTKHCLRICVSILHQLISYCIGAEGFGTTSYTEQAYSGEFYRQWNSFWVQLALSFPLIDFQRINNHRIL